MKTIEILKQMTKKEACEASNDQLTKLYNSAIIDESDLETVLTNSFDNGVYWASIRNEEKEKKIKEENLNSGIWLAITEISFYGYRQLIENIIGAVGFSYDECFELMEESGCNNDILKPIVESIFSEVIEVDFNEDEEIDFYTAS